jgi:hypothetical protein
MLTKGQPSPDRRGSNIAQQTSGAKTARSDLADAPDNADNILLWSGRSSRKKPLPKPRPAPTAEPIEPEQTSLWASILDSILEGFALYGASIHPVAYLEHCAQRSAPSLVVVSEVRQPPRRDEGRRAAAVRPQVAMLRRASFAFGGQRRKSREAASSEPATPWAQWRREVEIRKAVSALEKFDDRALNGLGIPDRSLIEQVVRFCRDC